MYYDTTGVLRFDFASNNGSNNNGNGNGNGSSSDSLTGVPLSLFADRSISIGFDFRPSVLNIYINGDIKYVTKATAVPAMTAPLSMVFAPCVCGYCGGSAACQNMQSPPLNAVATMRSNVSLTLAGLKFYAASTCSQLCTTPCAAPFVCGRVGGVCSCPPGLTGPNCTPATTGALTVSLSSAPIGAGANCAANTTTESINVGGCYPFTGASGLCPPSSWQFVVASTANNGNKGSGNNSSGNNSSGNNSSGNNSNGNNGSGNNGNSNGPVITANMSAAVTVQLTPTGIPQFIYTIGSSLTCNASAATFVYTQSVPFSVSAASCDTLQLCSPTGQPAGNVYGALTIPSSSCSCSAANNRTYCAAPGAPCQCLPGFGGNVSANCPNVLCFDSCGGLPNTQCAVPLGMNTLDANGQLTYSQCTCAPGWTVLDHATTINSANGTVVIPATTFAVGGCPVQVAAVVPVNTQPCQSMFNSISGVCGMSSPYDVSLYCSLSCAQAYPLFVSQCLVTGILPIAPATFNATLLANAVAFASKCSLCNNSAIVPVETSCNMTVTPSTEDLIYQIALPTADPTSAYCAANGACMSAWQPFYQNCIAPYVIFPSRDQQLHSALSARHGAVGHRLADRGAALRLGTSQSVMAATGSTQGDCADVSDIPNERRVQPECRSHVQRLQHQLCRHSQLQHADARILRHRIDE